MTVRSLLERHLAQAAYEGVMFPVESSSLSGGHDSVKHTAWKVRGAEIEHTGQRAYTGKLRIPLIDGLDGWSDLFPGRFAELVRVFEATPQGTLVHPTRGSMSVQIDEWHEDLAVRMTNGCVLEVTFTEVRGEAEVLFQGSNADATSPEQQVVQDATKADAEVAKHTGNLGDKQPPKALTPTVAAAVQRIGSGERSYLEIRNEVQRVLSDVNAILAYPSLIGLVAHDAREALMQLRSSVLRFAESLVGSVQTRQVTVPVTMTLAQVAALPEAFGDARRASELLATNAIADPLRVRAGTVLTIIDR